MHSSRRDVMSFDRKNLKFCGISKVGFCVNNSGILILVVLQFNLCGYRETSLKLNHILCELDLFFVQKKTSGSL